MVAYKSLQFGKVCCAAIAISYYKQLLIHVLEFQVSLFYFKENYDAIFVNEFSCCFRTERILFISSKILVIWGKKITMKNSKGRKQLLSISTRGPRTKFQEMKASSVGHRKTLETGLKQFLKVRY